MLFHAQMLGRQLTAFASNTVSLQKKLGSRKKL